MSSSHHETGGIEVRIISGESLLEAMEEGRKEEEGRGMSGGYIHQGDTIINGLLPDTGMPSESVYCAHFSEKPGTLSSLGGVSTTPSLYLIDLSY